MGFADGFYYGQGRLIVDNSTLSVGDIIRVRSMSDTTKVWNKTVASIAAPLIFDIPGKDYYKISLVQTIGGVATEILSIYRSISYGETVFIELADKTTLRGLQAILNGHSEASILNIGDELNITVSGLDWPVIIGAIDIYDDHDIILVSKYTLPSAVAVPSSSPGSYSTSNMRNSCTTFYGNIKTEDKSFLKQKAVNSSTFIGVSSVNDYVFIPTITECGYPVPSSYVNVGESDTNHPIPLLATQANRAKTTESGTTVVWATASGQYSNDRWHRITSGGAYDNPVGGSCYVLPCFYLKADA